MENKNYFTELNNINVSDKTEKKEWSNIFKYRKGSRTYRKEEMLISRENGISI